MEKLWQLWSLSDNHMYVVVAALYERMRADQRKFGKSAWAAAVERMERLQYAVSKETLQLMRAKEICLEQRKHGLKEEVTQHTPIHHRRRPRCVCVCSRVKERDT